MKKADFNRLHIFIKVFTNELREKLLEYEINVISKDLKLIFKALPISDGVFKQDLKYFIAKFNTPFPFKEHRKRYNY
jgi:hypothetical protein